MKDKNKIFIIVFLMILIGFLLYINYFWKFYKKIFVNKIDILNEWIYLKNIVEEKNNLNFYSWNILNINKVYEYSKANNSNWYEILNSINEKNIGEIEKIQLYYIFKEILKYDENYIISKLWKIDKEYRTLNIKIEKIINAENLIIDSWNNKIVLNFNELKFLEIIFKLEPKRYNNISLLTDLIWTYNNLENKKNKELFFKIIEKLRLDLKNDNLDLINDFMLKIIKKV
jgi:hypothetical protein